MATIPGNLLAVNGRIARACALAQRPVSSVTLLAVSKTQEAQAVHEACAAGLHCFGENYVQEAIDKIAAVVALGVPRDRIEWHLIGPLQSNKTRVVAESFDWVHSVDRLKIAQRLSEQRPAHLPALQVCLQVNVSGESSKSGLSAEELPAVAAEVVALPRLRLRGLMAIPEPAEGIDAQRAPHRALREMFEALQREGLSLDTLSMGMSADLEAAVLEGSTVVRIGTALFGARPPVAR